MARSQETFGKKEREKKRLKKKEEKRLNREARKANPTGDYESMIAYVDENGQLTDTPPDPTKKKKVIKLECINLGATPRTNEEIDPIRKGKVTFFNDSKGYGFIKDLDDQESYFVHINAMLEEIGEGDKVQFELEPGQKGLNAVRVKKVV